MQQRLRCGSRSAAAAAGLLAPHLCSSPLRLRHLRHPACLVGHVLVRQVLPKALLHEVTLPLLLLLLRRRQQVL